MTQPPQYRFARLIALLTIVAPALGTLAAVGVSLAFGFRTADVVLFVASYLLSMMLVEVAYHRMVVHRGFKTRPFTRWVLVALGSMAMIGPIGWWTANHRQHHAFSDVSGDPHSPHLGERSLAGRLRAFWHSHAGWLLDEASTTTNPGKYACDVYRDPVLRNVHSLYFPLVALGLIIPTLIGASIDGTYLGALRGLLWGGFARMFCIHHAIWALGSFGHTFGSQDYVTEDEARNNVVIAIATLGEGWHHNHHAFPSSARHGLAWWQFDPNYYFIRVLQLSGLAWDVRVPSLRVRAARRKPSDQRREKAASSYARA